MTDDSVTIGVVAHHVFCPRRAWLEVHGEQTDTAQVAVGVADHRAVHDETTSRPARIRSVDVVSDTLSVHGRCDSVEVDAHGRKTVVEHKAAPLRKRTEVTEAQSVQLALQVICLREAGHDVIAAAVWFSTARRRVQVPLTEELMLRAKDAAVQTQRVLASSSPPPPLEDDDRCQGCSHVSVCLPDEHRARPQARRIGVGDPIGRVLHLATPGSRARLRRGQIEVSSRDFEPIQLPLGQVAGLVVHGNADVSAALLREMLLRGFPVVWCTWSGRVVGWASSADGPNGDARGAQHRIEPAVALDVARNVVAGKIRNQRYVLRRYGLGQRQLLSTLADGAAGAHSPGDLFGIEGLAAAAYFREIRTAFRPEWATLGERTSRPARDVVNAALNVVYGLLLADVLRAVVACGLDPSGGVLHSSGRNKPALALDLMEELRPLLADSAVLWAFNNGELHESSFRRELGAIRMTADGRKTLIRVYERRAGSEFRHPEFGYRVTWRRAMEIQARMFLGLVVGTRDAYKPIVLR